MAATQTQLIPLAELSAGEAAAIRNQAIQAVVARASQELGKPIDQMVVRDIRPASDLDFATEDWFEVTGATGDTYETMSTGNMATERYVGFYGVKDDGVPSCTLLRFNIGGGDRVIWNLQPLTLYEGNERVGYCPAVVVIPQNAPYTISRYVRMVTSPSHIILKGFVVESRGRVVSP